MLPGAYVSAVQVKCSTLSQVLFKMDENGNGLLIELARLGQVEGGKLQVMLVYGACCTCAGVLTRLLF